MLKKLADAFNTSIDFLVYGDTEEKAQQSIKDNELLAQFKAVEEIDTFTIMKLVTSTHTHISTYKEVI